MRFKGHPIRAVACAAAGAIACTLGGVVAVARAQTVAAPVTTPAASPAAPAKTDLGTREFNSRCAVCHGLDGKGGGPYAEQLKRRLPDLTTLARRNGGAFPASTVYATIEGAGKGHGTRAMPVWGLDYTIQAAEALPEMPYNQAQYVRTRIQALVDHLGRLQAP